MAQLDPRRQPVRLTPMVFATVAALTVGTLIWRVFQPTPGILPGMALDPGAVMALETEAYAVASARPGFDQPEQVAILVRSGETLSQAIARTGVAPADAQAAVNLLSQAFDVVNVRAGMSIQAAIAKPALGSGQPAQLLGLTTRTGPAKQLTLTTSHDGAMRLRVLEENVRDERRVAIGTIDGSLFTSAAALGATPAVTNNVMKLFAHKLDFERDIKAGDTFKLIFDRKVTESGRTVETGKLLYAEIEAKGGINRFYSFQRAGEKDAQYFDETGKNIRGFLLATPVDGARTSSGFGVRRHPVLGFMKMHTGVDFAAGSGTPIVAAGDGVVQDAKWWGGYGRWVRVRHTGDWQTGYAHMSRIAVQPGQRVKQGQIIGYVGSTGRSTGPHLHFEVWYKNRPINPKDAKVPQGTILGGKELQAFMARKREIDTMIAMADIKRGDEKQALAMNSPAKSAPVAAAPTPVTLVSHERIKTYAALKPALSSTRGMN
ncbi:M23 family metallopeptidase [Asticcacaulis endophyticus]|nr:peptidoglycan DD-metalloendopeptidase family protein [Asticcacaulis endophyticus]